MLAIFWQRRSTSISFCLCLRHLPTTAAITYCGPVCYDRGAKKKGNICVHTGTGVKVENTVKEVAGRRGSTRGGEARPGLGCAQICDG